jgi:hypothetical protein
MMKNTYHSYWTGRYPLMKEVMKKQRSLTHLVIYCVSIGMIAGAAFALTMRIFGW